MARNGVRMADIAEKFGVSVVTVSKALADKDGVGPALKSKIQDAAAAMGYSKKGRADAGGPAGRSVAVVMAERCVAPEHSFYWALYLEVVEALKEHGYNGSLEVVRDESETPGYAAQNRAGGILVLGEMSPKYLAKLVESGLPVTLLDFYCGDIAAVVPDSFFGGFEMAGVLLEAGHERIGFVGSLETNVTAQDMYWGYCKALRARGISPREDWLIHDRDENGIFERYRLPAEMPAAFVCCSDQTACYFIRDLAAKGCRVPEDVSVTGYYDYIFATLSVPQLTTYRIDLRRMAAEAVKTILPEAGRSLALSNRIVVGGCVVRRDSVSKR